MITNSTLSKPAPLSLLKVREVAKLLRVSRQSVKALIDCGDLEAGKMTPTHPKPKQKPKRVHWRVTRDSLARFYKKRFDRDLDEALQPPTR